MTPPTALDPAVPAPRGTKVPRRWLFPAVFLVVVTTLAFLFHGGLSANPVSRALTVLGVVEQGTLSADAWPRLTSDRAIVGGHTYSDKAPLSSFVVIPFYWVWHLVRERPYQPGDLAVIVLLGDVVAAAIPFAAFVLLLVRRAERWTSPREAVLLAMLGAFGTSLLSYAGVYFGHALSGALLAFAYDAATRQRREVLAGFLGGLAVLAELPLSIGVALIGLYLVTRPSGLKLAARYTLGGLPCLLALGAYDAAITGSPFDPPYRHLTPEFTHANPLVLDLHSLSVARDLLFSEYRGLFFYAPSLLLLLPLGLVKAESPARRALLAATTIAQLAFLSSFWMWDGGWAIGPRHLAPLMMILLLEGVDALARTPWARLPFVGLASIGLAINVIAVATNPFAPSLHPFRDLYWPAFARGEMAPDTLFHMLGFPLGRAGVLVWSAAFAVAAYALGRLAEREEPRAA